MGITEGTRAAEAAGTPYTVSPAAARRRTLLRAGSYAVPAAVVLLAVLTADRARLADQFARLSLAGTMFPEVLTVALLNTVLYTAGGFVFGLVLGLGIAVMRLSGVRLYRWLAMAYIEVFRGLPALLVFVFVGVGVPLAFPGVHFPGGVYGQVTFALGLVAAAYMAETIRAGIEAVPRGQWEAARSLGMSHGRALVSVVAPQAFRIVVPPLTNELILLFKDSSLVLFLGVTLQDRELTKFGQDMASASANTTPIVVAGCCYLLITVPLSVLVRRLERRNHRMR
ncbi:ABC transporter permease subunit [Streptomyces sp. PRKS01-65]|nr:amino acid ABC transporter permease [Streptomyces harenosi]NEY30964.1 ABC transporter permease subunit [Streptomyces harenosi]